MAATSTSSARRWRSRSPCTNQIKARNETAKSRYREIIGRDELLGSVSNVTSVKVSRRPPTSDENVLMFRKYSHPGQATSAR